MTVRALSLAFILFWLVLGLYFIQQGLKLRLGTISSPEAGFMPFLIGIVLIGFCIASAVPLMRPQTEGSPARVGVARIRDPAIVVTSMIAYVLLLERLGFVACTAVLIAFLTRVVGGTTLVGSAILGCAATASCYVVFGMLLGVRLP